MFPLLEYKKHRQYDFSYKFLKESIEALIKLRDEKDTRQDIIERVIRQIEKKALLNIPSSIFVPFEGNVLKDPLSFNLSRNEQIIIHNHKK
jgi:hypothetical protein